MSRRLLLLIMVGVGAIGVASLLPSEPAEWLSDTSSFRWVQEKRWAIENNWFRRARETRRWCGWRRIVLCETLPPLSGPLAAPAVSMLQGIRKLSCQRLWSTRMAAVPLAGDDRAFQFCGAPSADTSVSIGLDLEGAVFSLDRAWRPSDPGATYWQLVRTLDTRFGPHHLCPQSDDLATTENRRWAQLGWNIGVHLFQDSVVHFDYELGPIACHVG